MTLYYTLVFALLVLEIGIFLGLIVPMPYKMKRGLFTFISESPIIAKLQYGMKITFIFILILFIDSVNRVYRVQQELSTYSKDGSSVGRRAATLGTERMEVQARKFYSQRNMYLCGFTLFLSLILNRTYIMILEILQLEEKVKQYKENQGKGSLEEVARLKKEIASRDTDIQVLKKQCEGLTNEYHKLGDQLAKENKDTPKKDL